MTTTKIRPMGAAAELDGRNPVRLTSLTGGELTIAMGADEVGFNPLDLLYASLASCMVLSLRLAATKQGMADRFSGARAQVSGEKSQEAPARVEQFTITLEILGCFSATERQQLVEAAEQICTVSNTLTMPTRPKLIVKAV